MYEWLNDLCNNCKGARELIVGKRRIECSVCGSTGIENYSDRKRSKITGLSVETVRESGDLLKQIHEEIERAERRASATMSVKLG